MSAQPRGSPRRVGPRPAASGVARRPVRRRMGARFRAGLGTQSYAPGGLASSPPRLSTHSSRAGATTPTASIWTRSSEPVRERRRAALARPPVAPSGRHSQGVDRPRTRDTEGCFPPFNSRDPEGEAVRSASVGQLTVVYWINRSAGHLYRLSQTMATASAPTSMSFRPTGRAAA